jgi:hypothetical protein
VAEKKGISIRDVKMKNGKTIAEIISALLNAPLVAFFSFTILILVLNPLPSLEILVISWSFGAILPFVIIIGMALKGITSDIYASDRKTRTKPFIGAMISYLIGTIILAYLNSPNSLTALMMCYVINSFILLLITQIWKISIHTSGITGPVTFLVHQIGTVMLPLFLLLLPVTWARIKLKAHTKSQTIAGALITIGLTLAQIKIYL